MNPAVKRLSVLMAAAFVDMMGSAIVFPLLPFYALRLHARDWMVGWLIAAFFVMQLAVSPLWGRLSDRYGRRAAILMGLATEAIAFVVFGLATSLWMLFVSRLVQGAGGGTTGVLQAYVGDVTAPQDRAKALGWLSASTGAGIMMGPGIGSIAVSLGPAAPGLFAAGLCILNILFAWRWLPETAPRRTAAQRAGDAPVRSIRSAILEVLRSPRGDVGRLIWIYALGMLGYMSMNGVLALYLNSDFGVTEKTIGIFFVYVGALSVVMRALILGRLIDAYGETKVMRIGAILLALGLGAIPLSGNVVVLAIIIALVPTGTACMFPSCTALLTHRTPDRERGQMLGVAQAFGGASRVIAPLWSTAVFGALGAVYGQIGRGVPFFIAGAIVAFVAGLAFQVEPHPMSEPVVEGAGG
jgi:MFS family permease